jgi:hypothetical protein
MTFLARAQRAAIGGQHGGSLSVCRRKQCTQSLIGCLEHCIEYVSGRHKRDYMSYGRRIDPEGSRATRGGPFCKAPTP